MQILALLVVALPLLSGVMNGLFCRRISDRNAGIIASSLMVISAVCASVVFYNVANHGEIYHIILWRWLHIEDIVINAAIYVDQLTSLMFLVVTIVSTIVHIYSLGYMSDDQHLPKFLSFLSLFTFFMLSLVAADNFIQLFFGWEGVGLCSYLLIGYWYQKDTANEAAIKAFITNRVSDCAFILGLIAILVYVGSTDFQVVFAQNKILAETTINIIGQDFIVLDAICLLLFIGCMGKSAQIGLHIWLPDAMEGPTPVSALIHAATMVTAGVFLLARCSYLFEYSPKILQLVTIIGGITCLFAATIAVAQNDIKKIIAYSTCSQLGYMFVACGVSAYHAGIFHLVTHATFKALLFLCAGNVIHACHQQDILQIGGLRKKMPITYCYFLIGSLAIIGVFPLAGYYSKDLILELAYLADGTGRFVFVLGIIAAILTAVYSVKIILLVFHGQTKLSDDVWEHVHEASGIMNLPLMVLCVGAVFSGLIGYYVLAINSVPSYFANSIYVAHHDHTVHEISTIIELLPSIVGITGILVGIYIYKDKLFITIANKLGVISEFVSNKYYFDELYSLIFVRPVNILVQISDIFDKKVVDQLCSVFTVRLIAASSWLVSQLQTGYIFSYILLMMMSVIGCITVMLLMFISA